MTLPARVRVAIDLSHLPQPPRVAADWDHIAGMLVGLAIGDSLGNTSESQTPGARRAAYGEIHDYLPNRFAEFRRVGLPSDDTQLAFRTLEHLLENDGVLDPQRLADKLASARIFGMGSTVRAFFMRGRGPTTGSMPRRSLLATAL